MTLFVTSRAFSKNLRTFGNNLLYHSSPSRKRYRTFAVVLEHKCLLLSVCISVLERPRTFDNLANHNSQITERSRSFANKTAYWTHCKTHCRYILIIVLYIVYNAAVGVSFHSKKAGQYYINNDLGEDDSAFFRGNTVDEGVSQGQQCFSRVDKTPLSPSTRSLFILLYRTDN